jgi:hypothetical protein
MNGYISNFKHHRSPVALIKSHVALVAKTIISAGERENDV